MALWGNNDNVGTAGSVSLNYATKVVTGGALTGQVGTLFGESGKIQEGDTISFGVKTKPGVFFGDAVVASIASTTSLTIGSTAGLSGAAIAGTSFQGSQQPDFVTGDSKYSERNSDYSSQVYGVSAVQSTDANGTVYDTGAGWVGVQTYIDSSGALRVKKEILVAMSGITTGNAPVYPNIETAN
jgi:hypothetical protein